MPKRHDHKSPLGPNPSLECRPIVKPLSAVMIFLTFGEESFWQFSRGTLRHVKSHHKPVSRLIYIVFTDVSALYLEDEAPSNTSRFGYKGTKAPWLLLVLLSYQTFATAYICLVNLQKFVRHFDVINVTCRGTLGERTLSRYGYCQYMYFPKSSSLISGSRAIQFEIKPALFITERNHKPLTPVKQGPR